MELSEFIKVISDYNGISEFIKNYSYDEIVDIVSGLLSCARDDLLKHPMGGYSKGQTSGAYHAVLKDLKINISYYDWLYQRLFDDISREVFTNLLRFRICPDMEFIKNAYDGENPQYFDKSIVTCDENEVFVDCGGYIGDTALSYIENFGSYKRIYTYEPEADNVIKCHENLDKYPNIVIRPAGVGEKGTNLAFFGDDSSGSFMAADRISSESEVGGISIISLDEDINEPISFIKMDIEGFEIPAILGAKNHIKNDYPKLAICLYHVVTDIWEIPKLIDYIREDYRFYIRHYWEDQNWETVLYAIPYDNSSSKRVVAMSSEERPWSNVELIKDCGIIPYLLHKEYGFKSIMVGGKSDEKYSNLELVKGLEMEFLPDSSEVSKIEYIEKNAKKIDLLVLRGPYSRNFILTKKYKELNPEGRVFLGLDANSEWMDRIVWSDDDFVGFMNCCDVIGASCTTITEYLDKKWPWEIECFPNGYYDLFEGRVKKIPFEKKENTILTVSRIGTAQKATDIMLLGFALVSDMIPEWKLRLIGNIEDGYSLFIKEYFERFPKLKDRVIFEGAISDKEMLMNEYEKAKVFALSSVVEGAPNVAAEALVSGLTIVTTNIDAACDMVDYGRCGRVSPIGDIEAFGRNLLEECSDQNLKARSEYAREYAKNFYDMTKIVGRLYERIGL